MNDLRALAVSQFTLGCFALLCAGCASTPDMDIIISESPRGAVYLERIPDRSFQAAHPITIEQATLIKVLQGIMVQENAGLLRSLLAGQSGPAPAFTEDEIRYLAPLLADGLARAAPDQRVGFRLVQRGAGFSQPVGAGVGSSERPPAQSLPETTRGFLSAYGRSLYVTIPEYRVRQERPDTIAMANRRVPDSTGLQHRRLSFTPESAQRPDSYRGTASPDATLVIDYELLASLPLRAAPGGHTGQAPASTAPASSAVPSSADAQLRSLQEQMRQKDVELEELRKELQDIRKQLKEPSGKP